VLHQNQSQDPRDCRKISRHFLWNKKSEDREKCNSLAAWDMACKPK
jgi:hypothetical protein